MSRQPWARGGHHSLDSGGQSHRHTHTLIQSGALAESYISALKNKPEVKGVDWREGGGGGGWVEKREEKKKAAERWIGGWRQPDWKFVFLQVWRLFEDAAAA